jgi:alpha-ketoglutarate-dependent taurine dioxygenase
MNPYPLRIECKVIRPPLIEWLEQNREYIEESLTAHGAVVFKNALIDSPKAFEIFARAISREFPEFAEESSPRSHVSGQVFTSTDYPAEFEIQFHSEYSYAARWPMKLYFACLQSPSSGGETPIADNRVVLANMRPQTREKFAAMGVLYVRNYRPNVGVSWQRAFGTSDRNEVLRRCEATGIECEWRSDDRLRTWQRRVAFAEHPKTKQLVWFNHALFFNVKAIEPKIIRDTLLTYPENDPLYTNTLFGDGSSIESEIIEELRALYLQASSRSTWDIGDVLLIDNMQTAHGRAAYSGPRNIVVLMADPCSATQATFRSSTAP